jgi:hypothetical protein
MATLNVGDVVIVGNQRRTIVAQETGNAIENAYRRGYQACFELEISCKPGHNPYRMSKFEKPLAEAWKRGVNAASRDKQEEARQHR